MCSLGDGNPWSRVCSNEFQAINWHSLLYGIELLFPSYMDSLRVTFHPCSLYTTSERGYSLTHIQWLCLLLITPSKHPSEADKTRVLALPAKYRTTCLLVRVLVSVPDPAIPLRVRALRSHQLGVGVVSAHSSVSMRVDAQTQLPQLTHSHIWTSEDSPMNKSKILKVDYGLNPGG